MANSIVNKSDRKPVKPSKPYPQFPLYAHASGRWAKKIKGRTHFFGPWRDWKAALERFEYEVGYLQRGIKPPPQDTGRLTVGELVNQFLAYKEDKVSSKELSLRTWTDYKRVGESLIAILGRHTDAESLTPDDFKQLRTKLGKNRGLVSLGNDIGRCRAYFKYAYDDGLIDRPIRMGVSFAKPSRKALAAEREEKPQKIFTIDELTQLYADATKPMKCFMLLALNGGLGNGDIGRLEAKHLKNGWIDYPRPKTLVKRSFPLWPETGKAIDLVRQSRRPDLAYLFLTKRGMCWFKGTGDCPISKEFRKLCLDTGLHQKGRGFYSLRHQFRTIADSQLDKVAIDRVMGHSDASMASNYREWIEPERLQAVVDHVRDWVKPMWEVNA